MIKSSKDQTYIVTGASSGIGEADLVQDIEGFPSYIKSLKEKYRKLSDLAKNISGQDFILDTGGGL